MARRIDWSLFHQSELTDYYGYLGPFKMFTLSQLGTPEKPEQQWQITSHILPTKQNKKVYYIEVAQDVCQEVIDKFSAWLAEGPQA